MRTRSSSNLPVESLLNPLTSNPKHRNRRRSKQPFILEESPVDTMVDQRTMAELLRAPTEGYADAIVIPSILVEQFELKHNLINMMTSDQFFGPEKDNPHDHIRWFNKITSTIKYKDVPNSAIKLMLFPFSLAGVARRWLEKEPSPDQDSLNSAAGGNLLERRTQDVLKIIENKSKQTSDVTTAMTAILKQFQATPPSAFVKAVEEICVTCGGAHPYYQCLAAGGNNFPKLKDNIQGYVAAAAVNYNQGNSGYHPPGVANQIHPSGFAQLNVQNNQNRFSQPQGYNRGNNFNQDQSYQAPTQQNQVVPLSLGSLPSNTISNPKGELKAITTRSGIVLDGPSFPIPPSFINLKEDERVEETLTDQDLAEYTIKVPKKLGDPGKFLIPYGFSELKCKALADLGASINLMPLSVWKSLCLLELISTRMTLELANRAICTTTGIARDVFVLVGKFTFPVDFVIVDYECDPRVPFILGRPFLRTARALINVHEEEMILNDDLFATNHQSGNPTFSSHPELTSPEVKDDVFDPEGGSVLIEKLLDLDSTKDLHPPHNVNPLNGSTTSSSSPNHLLEEFADELALITFPSGNDDLPFDIESDLKEIEYLLNDDPIMEMDSILEDSVDKDNLVDFDDNLADIMPEMFTDEHALDYSSPSERRSKKKLVEVITLVALDKNEKKLAISHASLILEDFDPPLYELPFFKEVPGAETLLSFSFENEEKVIKPGILTSKGVHSSLIPELSHRGYKVFKIIKILKIPMEIFLFSHGEDIRILDVPCPHFYPHSPN
uniref:Reverse transcriptase domain-containing protein n=1 Tax=Tanacetum cinerariifolium TaxID=118510 RepID=A0A6L2MG45_TANCI|nr:hypothetical protein [Tanacetum cinerariifolium]